MTRHLPVFMAVSLALVFAAAAPVQAQVFPAQPVRIISPFAAGSGPDVIARIIGERMGAGWKQSVVVDARPGANGFLAANAVKQAQPTGYDLLLADVGSLSISPSLFKNLPYDPKTDFVPVGGVYRTSFFIVVGTNSPIKSVKDLAAAAAASPSKITYGSNAVGGPLHLGAVQVENVTGTKMVHVPYKEISQLYLAVSTGEIDWAMGSLASTGPLLKAGKLRLVAVADNVRSTAQPTVPTFEESGGARPIIVRSWVALMALKGTPAATVGILNKSLNDVQKQPEVVERFSQFGFLPYALTPPELTALINSETVYYADMVKRTGANAD